MNIQIEKDAPVDCCKRTENVVVTTRSHERILFTYVAKIYHDDQLVLMDSNDRPVAVFAKDAWEFFHTGGACSKSE